jgi:hypothetical protein
MNMSHSSQAFPHARLVFTHENESTKEDALTENSAGILTVTREMARERRAELAVTDGHSAHGGS